MQDKSHINNNIWINFAHHDITTQLVANLISN